MYDELDDEKSADEELNEIYRGYRLPACTGPHPGWIWHVPTDTMKCDACFTPMGWTEVMRRLRAFDKIVEENNVLWATLKTVGIKVPTEN